MCFYNFLTSSLVKSTLQIRIDTQHKSWQKVYIDKRLFY